MERLKILIFRIKDSSFAFPSKNVKEILDSYGNLKTVFYGGSALQGLIGFEGDLVSVLNAQFIMDIEGEGDGPIVLICKEKGMEKGVGITVAEVKGMEYADFSRVSPPREGDAKYISGFIGEGEAGKERLVTLLDLKPFLDYAYTKIERL